MEKFYEEQLVRLEDQGVEPLPLSDTLCLALDLVRPKTPNSVTLKDLKACKQAKFFFNTFLNINKHLEAEEKDPFVALRERNSEGPGPVRGTKQNKKRKKKTRQRQRKQSKIYKEKRKFARIVWL